MALWFISVQFFFMKNKGVNVGHMLSFFTMWNFLAQLVFFVLATIASWLALYGKPHVTLELVVAVMFEVCLPSSILVSVVMWAVLAPECAKSTDQKLLDS